MSAAWLSSANCRWRVARDSARLVLVGLAYVDQLDRSGGVQLRDPLGGELVGVRQRGHSPNPSGYPAAPALVSAFPAGRLGAGPRGRPQRGGRGGSRASPWRAAHLSRLPRRGFLRGSAAPQPRDPWDRVAGSRGGQAPPPGAALPCRRSAGAARFRAARHDRPRLARGRRQVPRTPAATGDRSLSPARPGAPARSCILDVQPGRSDFMTEARRLEPWLRQPDVSLALDPEWNMGPRGVPGRSSAT